MKFETFELNNRTVYPVYLAGFHTNSACLDGEVFINPQRAYQYCEGKVIHVKEVPFYSQEKAESFVKQQAQCWVNHSAALGCNPREKYTENECEQFVKVIEEVMFEYGY